MRRRTIVREPPSFKKGPKTPPHLVPVCEAKIALYHHEVFRKRTGLHGLLFFVHLTSQSLGEYYADHPLATTLVVQDVCREELEFCRVWLVADEEYLRRAILAAYRLAFSLPSGHPLLRILVTARLNLEALKREFEYLPELTQVSQSVSA